MTFERFSRRGRNPTDRMSEAFSSVGGLSTTWSRLTRWHIGFSERRDWCSGQPVRAANGRLPINRADVEVEVMNLAASAGTSLGDAFDLTSCYRSYDCENASSEWRSPGPDAVEESPAPPTISLRPDASQVVGGTGLEADEGHPVDHRLSPEELGSHSQRA